MTSLLSGPAVAEFMQNAGIVVNPSQGAAYSDDGGGGKQSRRQPLTVTGKRFGRHDDTQVPHASAAPIV
jgi:hypothetical protein